MLQNTAATTEATHYFLTSDTKKDFLLRKAEVLGPFLLQYLPNSRKILSKIAGQAPGSVFLGLAQG